MSLLPPKPPVPATTMDEAPLRRIHFRLWQIALSALVVLLTGWFYTFGPLPGITATFLAKHLLVAILAAGLDLHAEGQTPPRA
jgi:hypothetical protein